MSCSDKLARWACLGLQGCLLSALMTGPLHLASLTVAAMTTVQEEAGEASAGGEGNRTSGSQALRVSHTHTHSSSHAHTRLPSPAGPTRKRALPMHAGPAALSAARSALHRAVCGRMQRTLSVLSHGGEVPSFVHRQLEGGGPPARVQTEVVTSDMVSDPDLGLAPSPQRTVGSGERWCWGQRG